MVWYVLDLCQILDCMNSFVAESCRKRLIAWKMWFWTLEEIEIVCCWRDFVFIDKWKRLHWLKLLMFVWNMNLIWFHLFNFALILHCFRVVIYEYEFWFWLPKKHKKEEALYIGTLKVIIKLILSKRRCDFAFLILLSDLESKENCQLVCYCNSSVNMYWVYATHCSNKRDHSLSELCTWRYNGWTNEKNLYQWNLMIFVW